MFNNFLTNIYNLYLNNAIGKEQISQIHVKGNRYQSYVSRVGVKMGRKEPML